MNVALGGDDKLYVASGDDQLFGDVGEDVLTLTSIQLTTLDVRDFLFA